jgi:hypothetical protein
MWGIRIALPSDVRSLLSLYQIAFGNDALVSFGHVSYAVARLALIVGCWHYLADLITPCNSVVCIARDKMDRLADGELMRQIWLLHVGDKTFRDRRWVTSVRTGNKKAARDGRLFLAIMPLEA